MADTNNTPQDIFGITGETQNPGGQKIVGEPMGQAPSEPQMPPAAPSPMPSQPPATAPVTPPPVSAPISSMPEQHVDTSQPTYNEFLRPKKNYALIAIIAGVVLLAATAGLYYYFMVLNKPEPVVEQPIEPEPAVEEPTVVDVEPTPIEGDQVITEIEDMTSTPSPTGLSDIEQDLNSVDFEGIDTELQTQGF